MSDDAIADGLNGLLADYVVFYHKLRSYHWSVRGPDFFELHAKFEEQYDAAAMIADELAERIVALGGTPQPTLTTALETARINEDPGTPSPQDMVSNVVADLRTLNARAGDVIEVAESEGDRTTANLLDDIVDQQEDNLWMFEAFLEK
ncbi:MAG: Dps family protein [Bradymonadaceae bacterium]